ncbi:MFS transporter [Flavilitoribacter nigricans]|nr:MFS transporter [Flavilitoribacter nigricans]
MRSFWYFIRTNRYLLFFGVLLTYFSSFGQTFLISLYIPEIERVFGFTNTGLSSLYAVATMGSAFSLPFIGRLVDTVSLRRFSIGVVLGLGVACLLLSLAIHPVMILFGFFGLRLFGQGLMSHTSISTMARAFDSNRGKAISIATLGHPLGEATLPLLIALLIGALGWRTSLQLEALSLAVVVLPLILFFLKGQERSVIYPHQTEGAEVSKSKNPFRVMRDKDFWIITPMVFIMGFLNTAIFFFQIKLGNSRGWDPAWVAGSLSVYAIASALSMMSSGPLVDSLTARRLFPFVLLPYTAGVILLASFTHPLSYPLALVLIAISNGGGSTIKNALFAEVFGTEIIGTVRSVFMTIIVFSTALGPISFGLLLDAGWSYGQVFWLSAGLLGLIIIWSLRPLRGRRQAKT